MKVVNGDLFDTILPIIAHQTNCMGAMKSGVAKQVKEKYSGAFKVYKEKLKEKEPEKVLGTSAVYFGVDKVIMNIYGQFDYRHTPVIGLSSSFDFIEQYTDYDAFRSGMIDGIAQIRDFVADSTLPSVEKLQIAIPYRIGCDRGGGDWEEMKKILLDIERIYNVEFTAYKL